MMGKEAKVCENGQEKEENPFMPFSHGTILS
jgi:hypothetical protein